MSGLVDFVYEQHWLLLSAEGLPQLAPAGCSGLSPHLGSLSWESRSRATASVFVQSPAGPWWWTLMCQLDELGAQGLGHRLR